MTNSDPSPDSLVDRLMELYERAPVVRMLVAAYPPLTIAEAGVLAAYKWWRARRMYVFTEEIISLRLNPPEEQVKSREFCEAFGATALRVLETAREDKIRLFARLFASYVRQNDCTPEAFDALEEDLAILDDLSFREFQLLLVLRKYELQFPSTPDKNEAQRTRQYWDNFKVEATKHIGISNDELNPMLQRLIRTGLYQMITGTYWDYLGDRGYLTPRFAKFLQRLNLPDSQV
jgi:hypothetical protein